MKTMMKSVCIFSLLGFFAAAALAQPTITGVTNGASYIPNGLPNAGVARGALFVIKGSNLGPASFVVASEFPLQTTIAGTSVRVTVGATSVAAIMYYAGASQVAAILPSSVPTGSGTLTVTANGQTSAPAPIVVVQNALGIFTANSSGAGDAIATLGTGFVTPTNAPNPGETVVLWGTGLGPVTSDETRPAVQSDLTDIPVEAFIGGKQANVVFRGRNGCCSSVDTIYVQIPSGVSGCATPVTLKIGNLVSNTVTIPIAASGRFCTLTNPSISTSDLLNWYSKGTFTFGGVSLIRTSVTTQPTTVGPVTLPGGTTRSDAGGGAFTKITVAPGAFGSGSLDLSAYGACVVTSYANSAIPAAVSSQSLDAGASIGVNGPGGSKTLARSTIAGNIFYSGSFDTTGTYLSAGQYTISGPGGPDVGSFTSTLTLAPPLTWTNQTTITSVTRANGVTVNWSGGDPAGYVQITGTSFLTTSGTNTVGASFTCNAKTSDGSFTVPSVVLLALPASGSTSAGGFSVPIPGTLSVSGVSGFARFQATGLDFGVLSSFVSNTSTVTYQ
jgi:uncharacterized protein (TIGR03437 family)